MVFPEHKTLYAWYWMRVINWLKQIEVVNEVHGKNKSNKILMCSLLNAQREWWARTVHGVYWKCTVNEDNESNELCCLMTVMLLSDSDKLNGAQREWWTELSSVESTNSVMINENRRFCYAECKWHAIIWLLRATSCLMIGKRTNFIMLKRKPGWLKQIKSVEPLLSSMWEL